MSTISAHLSRHLHAGENVVWKGQPRQGFLLMKSDSLSIPSSIAVVIFLGLVAIPIGQPDSLAAGLTILIVVLGLYVCVGRFFTDAHKRKHTWYTITDQRVLIVVDSPLIKRCRSVPHDDRRGLTVFENGNGTGNVYFERLPWLWQYMCPPNMLLSDLYLPTYLHCIEDPRSVVQLICEQREAHPPR